jgi:hypothetical protein
MTSLVEESIENQFGELSNEDIKEISDGLKNIDVHNNEISKQKICDLLNKIDLQNFIENITNKNFLIIDFFKYLLQIISVNFPKKKYISNDDNCPITGTLTDKDDFNITDFIFARMLYTYAMFLITNNLDGNSFLRNFYSNNILNVLKNLSDNKESKDIQLSTDLPSKLIITQLTDECIDGGRSPKCKHQISNEYDSTSCSRINYLLLKYNDKYGNPTVAIIDPGSYYGISNIKYRNKQQVYYLNALNDEILLKIGKINIRFYITIFN